MEPIVAGAALFAAAVGLIAGFVARGIWATQTVRVAQDKALAQASSYDTESAELLEFYHTEILRRGRERDQPAKKNGRKKAPVPAFITSSNGAAAHE